MELPRPIYNIGPFQSSIKNKDIQLNVYVSDKHFKIDLFEEKLKDSPDILKEYFRQLDRQEPDFVADEDEEGFYEDTLDEIHEWLLKPFMPIFHSLPPLNPIRRYTLDDCMFAEEWQYTIKAVEDELVPVFLKKTDGKENYVIGTQLPFSNNIDYSTFPIYSPNEVQVAVNKDATSLPAVPRKVFIQGRPESSFFKTIYVGDVRMPLRELRTYAKIHALETGDFIYTSRLHGLVQSDDGKIMGLLLSYIDCGGSTLHCAGASVHGSLELRRKWLDQVSRTLEIFHANGIIWGDAKADNVLIDRDDNAYLIDFGGGHTEG